MTWETDVVVEDKMDETSRTVKLDVPFAEFMRAVIEKDVLAWRSGLLTGAGDEDDPVDVVSQGGDFMFSSSEVSGSAAIYPAYRDEDVPDGFDRYTSTEWMEDAERITQITIHPYGGRESLSEETGRDYEAEDKERLEWLVSVGDEVV